MASLNATSRRPEPKNGFISRLIVLSTAVLEHFHHHWATRSKSGPAQKQQRPTSTSAAFVHLSGDVVKALSTYKQLPFRLAILPSSGSQ
ncbi:hypothetical protein DPMN_154495 [Dreissena polymorpha]|uniref:Uncharacterized protein n=1 Tax=Dreissena polymorpha TaxID=45954 RepID=A0A9D4FRW5_DREPO|nr:hypothetical protein DPMN_154495 [Dreissena polymorpha]